MYIFTFAEQKKNKQCMCWADIIRQMDQMLSYAYTLLLFFALLWSLNVEY